MIGQQPRPGESSFAELYADREQLLESVTNVIDRVLPTYTVDGQTIVEFSECGADGDLILAAMNEAPRPAITMLLAVTGLSTNDVETALGFTNTYDIADTGDTLTHKDTRAQLLAPYLAAKLSEDLLKETVLSQTAYRWTLDHRRHYRKDFEAEVQDYLEKGGVPLLPDTEVDGSPDIAIPRNNDDMAVVGEIRSSNKQDLGTRIREFESEIRDHAAQHPTAKCVIVIEFAENIDPKRYSQIQAQLQDRVGDRLDAVYTHEELDQLLIDCQRWSPQLQQPLQAF